ncbi:hypothetical protein [Prescottella agglutinans]|uniref:Ribbon-helix-helix protein CopG domain-containing protein n=1 Tax=Prescottella agglutinans TaxID=1644129 RepID=A0ABT6MJY1_9NOCA|nr:hypothetical protein [Prescottella agglutinans]MDH6284622.1 hypothetical protein [Prescottella agglutinans]
MRTETMPARWDPCTAQALTRLRETTGRSASFLVTQAVLQATSERADLSEHFATPTRGQAIRTTVTLRSDVLDDVESLAHAHPTARGERSRYAVVRACVRWWLDTDLDELSDRLGRQWIRMEARRA